eukprot:9736981-Lingulodinium_polyedra.AAC.1
MVVCGGWWSVVVRGGLWWSALVCRVQWRSAVVCGRLWWSGRLAAIRGGLRRSVVRGLRRPVAACG